jgi:hypothetical protein
MCVSTTRAINKILYTDMAYHNQSSVYEGLDQRWPSNVTTLAQQFYFVDRTLYQRWRWILVNNQWHSCMSEQSMAQLHEWTINDTAYSTQRYDLNTFHHFSNPYLKVKIMYVCRFFRSCSCAIDCSLMQLCHWLFTHAAVSLIVQAQHVSKAI